MRNILRNRKAQNTAEYAILIALVIGGVVAMQTYAQRALQGRIRDASTYMRNNMSGGGVNLGNATGQYEPYYTCSSSETTRDSRDQYDQDGADSFSNVSTTAKSDAVLAPTSTTGE